MRRFFYVVGPLAVILGLSLACGSPKERPTAPTPASPLVDIVIADGYSQLPPGLASALRCTDSVSGVCPPGVLVADMQDGIVTIAKPVQGVTLTAEQMGGTVQVTVQAGSLNLLSSARREKRSDGTWESWVITDRALSVPPGGYRPNVGYKILVILG